MLRDVPYCKSILACGIGALVLSLFFLTWVYPAFCSKVSQVKETKVREYMEDRYGISDHSASVIMSGSHDQEISKTMASDLAGARTKSVDGDGASTDLRPDDEALPVAKRR